MIRRAAMVAVLSSVAVSVFPQEQEEEYDEGYTYLEEGEVRTALEETLSQPEFARLRARPKEEENENDAEAPAWLVRLAEWLERLFDGEEETDGNSFSFVLPGSGTLLAVLAAILVVAVIVFLLRSALAARDKNLSEEESAARVFAPGAAPGELSPDEFWRRAMEHAGKRRFREGLRELLLGAMSATERRGLIRFRKGLTNRDYLYSVRGPARESFRTIATAFEHVYFGRRDATAESFREASQEYQKSFRGAVS
jgi:hypothetical protein